MTELILHARQPRWYVEGEVPDTVDGRFRMLATVTALAMVRLDQLGAEGEAASARLTEHFVEIMETEHREMGLGDPTLGKRIRQLVGALGKRVGLWRGATAGSQDWETATAESLYAGEHSLQALEFTASALHDFWSKLSVLALDPLEQGKLQ